ncbi:hypothetical protein D3C81_706580 [compost metagenome]
MTISAIASSIKASVAAELANVQLPEGVEVSAEVQQSIADAGVRGTLSAIGELSNANVVYISGSVEEGTDDVANFTPADILGELFGSVNS